MNRDGCFSVAVQASVQISWLVSGEPAQKQNTGILWYWKRIKKLDRNTHLRLLMGLYGFCGLVCVSQKKCMLVVEFIFDL